MERNAYTIQLFNGNLIPFLFLSNMPKEFLPINISMNLFQNIRNSYETILSMIWIEEKFNIIEENYYEWEQEIKESYDFFLYSQCGNSDNDCIMQEYGMSEIIVLNRRLNNLLSSIRLYQDQVLHQLSHFDNHMNLDLKDNFKSKMNKLYDEYVSYQIMEFVRNYMQHQGLIVERMRIFIPFNKNVTERCDLPYFVEANFKKLQSVEKFNKKIKLKDERINQIKWINLIKLVREYFESIVNLHNSYRKITSKIVEEEIKKVDEFIKMHYNDIKVTALCFYGEEEKDDFLMQYLYIDQLKKYRKDSSCINLSKYYIDKKVFIDSDKVSVNNAINLKIQYNMPKI